MAEASDKSTPESALYLRSARCSRRVCPGAHTPTHGSRWGAKSTRLRPLY
jgi:hypothetical protein